MAKPSVSDEDELRRFKELAREAECDEDPAAFDRVFKKVATPSKPKD